MADVDREALEYLVELGRKLVPVEKLQFGGRDYTRQEIKPVAEPQVTAIKISTLSSLADLCTGKFTHDGLAAGSSHCFEGFDVKKHVIHVVSPSQVQVVGARSNQWRDREILIDCKLTETADFPLGKWLTQDQFIIAVLSTCVPGGDRDYVAKLAGNAMSEKVTTSQDDGVSQNVGTRSGAHILNQETVKNIVEVKLYRTFREVEQPTSKFLFRLQQSGENIPTFAFFEADGGAWKLEAIENVARFLRTQVPDAVIAS